LRTVPFGELRRGAHNRNRGGSQPVGVEGSGEPPRHSSREPRHVGTLHQPCEVGQIDVRLPGKRNSNAHGARPVHLIITMIKWIRTSRLTIKNSSSVGTLQQPCEVGQMNPVTFRNNYPLVQISRIDGHRPLFRGLCQGKSRKKSRALFATTHRAGGSGSGTLMRVRTGSWMGPPQGKRAPRVGPICIVILASE